MLIGGYRSVTWALRGAGQAACWTTLAPPARSRAHDPRRRRGGAQARHPRRVREV